MVSCPMPVRDRCRCQCEAKIVRDYTDLVAYISITKRSTALSS
jgi:hypothetical protein